MIHSGSSRKSNIVCLTGHFAQTIHDEIVLYKIVAADDKTKTTLLNARNVKPYICPLNPSCNVVMRAKNTCNSSMRITVKV